MTNAFYTCHAGVIHVQTGEPRIKIEDSDATRGSAWRLGVNNGGDLIIQDATNVKSLLFNDSKLRLRPVGTAPTGASAGELYVDSSGTQCVFVGTSWQNTTSTGDCT